MTTTESIPWKILSATVGVGVLTEGWKLSEPCDETEPARSFTTEIHFEAPFAAPPVVHLGLTGFDLDEHTSARLTVNAEAITASGFVARISTWRNSRVYAAEFSWLAVGA